MQKQQNWIGPCLVKFRLTLVWSQPHIETYTALGNRNSLINLKQMQQTLLFSPYLSRSSSCYHFCRPSHSSSRSFAAKRSGFTFIIVTFTLWPVCRWMCIIICRGMMNVCVRPLNFVLFLFIFYFFVNFVCKHKCGWFRLPIADGWWKPPLTNSAPPPNFHFFFFWGKLKVLYNWFLINTRTEALNLKRASERSRNRQIFGFVLCFVVMERRYSTVWTLCW